MREKQLDEIRQRDANGYSKDDSSAWTTRWLEDTPAQMAADRHALLRFIEELRASSEPGSHLVDRLSWILQDSGISPEKLQEVIDAVKYRRTVRDIFPFTTEDVMEG